jgi:hypothetical protein
VYCVLQAITPVIWITEFWQSLVAFVGAAKIRHANRFRRPPFSSHVVVLALARVHRSDLAHVRCIPPHKKGLATVVQDNAGSRE